MLQVNMENTEQRGTGIENGSEWSDGTVHFDRTGPTEQSGPPRKVDRFFRNFSGWTEPIHSGLDRNFRKVWLNGSRPQCPWLPDYLPLFRDNCLKLGGAGGCRRAYLLYLTG